jgi:hypothetical protein
MSRFQTIAPGMTHTENIAEVKKKAEVNPNLLA